MNENIPDQALIQRIIKGETALLNQLMDRHKHYAYTIAYRVVGNPEDAEEVTQDAFVKAYRAFNRFKGDAKFTTWFYRIVFNAAISHKRKHRIKTEELEHTAISLAGDDDGDHLDERRKFIQLALNQMSEDDVLILTLYYFKELSTEEMEELTGFDKKNLKVKLFRARKRLGVELNRLLRKEVSSLL